jgi:hypothetical protein
VKNITFAILLAAFSMASLDAAVTTIYSDLPSFTAALGGAATVTQDFESFAVGTDLNGAAILPGMTATTAMPVLEAFGGGDRVLFALAGSDPTRTNPAYILTGGGYTALGFNIQSWDPDAPGTLDIAIQFSDGDSAVVNLSRPGGVAETDPQFFGIISSAAITSLMINEPPEVSIPCCEEVSLDDFVASTAVPEPGSALLGGAALVLLLARRIRR